MTFSLNLGVSTGWSSLVRSISTLVFGCSVSGEVRSIMMRSLVGIDMVEKGIRLDYFSGVKIR